MILQASLPQRRQLDHWAASSDVVSALYWASPYKRIAGSSRFVRDELHSLFSRCAELHGPGRCGCPALAMQMQMQRKRKIGRVTSL